MPDQPADSDNPLGEYLADIISDPLVIDGDDPRHIQEARENMWGIGLSAAQARQTSPAAVCAFVEAILERREEQLLERCGRAYPMVFYCWVDELAGQLRLSLVGDSPAGLPFGCSLRIVDRLDVIAEQFLGSPYLEGLSWDEIELVPLDADQPEPNQAAFVLDVWVQRIPRAASEADLSQP